MLWIQEQWVNRSKGHGCGDSDVYETRFATVGELYRFCLKEYGRCVSSCYVDTKEGKTKKIGWVFLKRKPYEDKPHETFLLETWVTIHDAPPTRTVEHHYHELPIK